MAVQIILSYFEVCLVLLFLKELFLDSSTVILRSDAFSHC